MTSERLFSVMENVRLRNALTEIAAGFTRDYETQKTLLAQAWIAISEKPQDYTIDAYIGIGYAVMRHKWEVYYAPPKNGDISNSAENHRARRKLIKYTKSAK